MSQAPQAQALLQQVQWRLQLVAIGWATLWAFLALWIVYTAAFLASRLGGLWAGYFSWQSLAVIPAAAVLVGLIFHRRPVTDQVARLVDQATNSKDLYLTLAQLTNSAGAYQPLVVQSAEQRAATISPTKVVQFRFRHWKPAWVWLTATAIPNLMLILAGLMFVLPQLDPFGVVQAAQRAEQRQERLAETRKATQLQLEAVRAREEQDSDGTVTDQAVKELKTAFNAMKPHEPKENQKTLMDEQRKLGELWRQLSAEKLKDLLQQGSLSEQSFGNTDEDLLRKWTKELQQGNAEGVESEMKQAMKDLQELKDQLERLSKADTPEEKQAAQQQAADLERQLKERLDRLNDLAEKKLNSKQLSAALQRAMQQLDAATNPEMMKEAMEGLQESLELSEMELQEIAQSAEDLKSLEEALKTLQMAKKLNGEEKLDGEQCQKCRSMKDYEELYRQLLAEMGGEGEGEGLGNRGQGKGGKAPEDNSVESDFNSEYAKSQVQAGKVLMSLKTQGESEEGEAVKDYQSLLRQVKQGVSEAILLEQIPPGYHDSIKSYFDSLEPANDD